MSHNLEFFSGDERLFEPTNDDIENVLSCSINYSDRDWGLYNFSYRNAIEILKISQRDQAYLLIPILYLVRHYLELSIKEAIVLISEFDSSPLPKFNHDLVRLWKEFCNRAEKTSYGGFDSKLKEDVQKFMDQIENLDPSATGFRFPVDKKTGKPIFPDKKYLALNLESFEKLADFFECLHIDIKQSLEGY